METGRVSGIAPEVWSRLGSGPPAGETLTARLAAPDTTDRLICAIDAEAQRLLLIVLEPADTKYDDNESRGLAVVTREMSVPGQPLTRFIDIACQNATGHDALDLIAGELTNRLADGREEPATSVAKVLAKWRRFWGQPPRQLLSREAQIGLFAELWFLCFWLLPRVGTAEAVTRWRGPLGTRHDFESPAISVEVKGTTSTRGAIHHINGIEQLSEPDQGILLFFSLRLADEAGGANTLPALATRCRTALAADDDALNRFESSLVLAGYSPTHDEEYAKLHLRVITEELYSVEGSFPRITPSNFATGVPAGVERLGYEINLAGFQHLRLARTPVEATALR